jgi:transcriptional regulator with XRE-family HTH domain
MDTQTPQSHLREIKAATGWSEPRIAKELGISQPTVNRLVNGQAECKASTWRALCDLREKVRVEPKRPRRKLPPKVPG